MPKDNDGLFISASLNIEQTVVNVEDDILKLNDILSKNDKGKVKLTSELDINKTQTAIQSQLSNISKKIKLNIDGLNLDAIQTDMKNIERQMDKSVQNINYKIKNIDTTIADTFKTAFNADGQLDINKTLDNARNVLGKYGTPTFSWVKDDSGEIIKIVADVKSLTGQIETLNYVLDDTGEKFTYFSGKSSEKGILKLISDIDKARSKYTTMLSEFEQTNSGIKSGLTNEISAVNQAINSLGQGGSVENVERLFNVLKKTANEIKVNLDTTASSFNKVTNAENTLAKMPATIQEIINNFSRLKNQPEEVANVVSSLESKLNKVNAVEVQLGRNKEWSEKYRDLVLSVKSAETQIKNLQLLEQADNSTAKQQSYYYEKMFAEINKVNTLKKQLITAGKEESNELKRQISNLEKRISYDEKQLSKKKLITNELEAQKNELRKIGEEELKLAQSRYLDKYNTSSARISALVSNFTDDLTILENKWKTSPIFNTEFEEKINSLRLELNNIGGNSSSLDEFRIKLNQLKNELTNASIVYKNSFTDSKSLQNIQKIKQDIQKLIYTIQSYQRDNSKAMYTSSGAESEYKQATDSMIASLKKLQMESDLTDKELKTSFDSINRQFRTTSAEIKATGNSGLSFFDDLKEKIRRFGGWMTITTAVSYLAGTVRTAITELKELDTILTEISKTSDRTDTSLKKLGENAFDEASKLGQKATDYLYGVQEASRAGFGESESEEMATLSILAQSAGDMTSDLANQYLIATDAAYQYNGNIEKLNATLDSQNYITNHNALNMTDLAEATKIAASQAETAGVGVDSLTAAVGTMIATTQQGGDIAGRAFKGILMNLQQVKGTAEEIGDGGEDITTESLTKYEKACADLGVSLKQVKDGVVSLRDPMEILEELASAVSKESEGSIKVANLINAVGGKYRGNQLNALLNNWDVYKKMLSEYHSEDAVGSAMQEAEKTAQSWEGQLNKLSNTWTKFVKNFANTDLIKGGLSALSSGINILDNLIDRFGALNTLLPIIGAGLSLKNVGKLTKMPVYAQPQITCA